MKRIKVLSVIGTRPEAIKLAPIIKVLASSEQFGSVVCVTGQHRDMLDQALDVFGIRPEFDLDIMKPGQDPSEATSSILRGLRPVMRDVAPDWVLVQGDTTTTFAGGLAAFYQGVSVGHVEAGLRTRNRRSPWPEEINRRLTSVVADLHFAPTQVARENLLREGIAEEAITVCGNTIVDALLDATRIIREQKDLRDKLDHKFSFLDPRKKILLVTGHRRESFGQPFQNICQALVNLSKRQDIEIVYPVHLNPNVREVVMRMLGGIKNVFLIEPLDYFSFVHLMTKAHIILTDSGGIQEEAPTLGKPVLVMRDVTERREAIEAGTALLVGTDGDRIAIEAETLLNSPTRYEAMIAAKNPFGDGLASRRIAAAIIGVNRPGFAGGSNS